MDKNAELIILRHRALFAKPGDLKEIVKLPLKRKAKLGAHEAMIAAPVEKIHDVIVMLHEATTAKEIIIPALQ